MDDYLAHVDYIVKLVGIDHIGISSDAIVDGWGVDDIHYSDAALASKDRWRRMVNKSFTVPLVRFLSDVV